MHMPTVKESSSRPRVAGKFLLHSGKKFWVRGVTYGTFRPQVDAYRMSRVAMGPDTDLIEALAAR
jgi:hypothetical protein